MAIDFKNTLVIGVSSRALFNLEKENIVFETGTIDDYRTYQLEHEDVVLEKGAAYFLVEALLKLNKYSKQPGQRLVEVIVMSKNSPDTGLRIHNSIKHYNLDITRSAFSGGESLAPFLQAFDVDLLLTKHSEDVQTAIDTEQCAAATIYDPPSDYLPDEERIRFAFDADAVIFSEESEYIYKTRGMRQFQTNELNNEDIELKDGPFAKFIRVLSTIHKEIGSETSPIKISIVTARNSPAHVRVIKTLRNWNVYVDQAFFLGGLPKDKILKALRPHIFFDDQKVHVEPASKIVPSSQVPYKTNSPLRKFLEDQATLELTLVNDPKKLVEP
ncbi:5'-nucleotidase [Pseudomonas benzenivorans]|uniref:5'-nucleotidase n=1 Tax=Pseudomonas benzenivorans TaxID=556533 RepID=A0ABZ0PX72_9PSED|nr:5'-nucleotidase [Pseudomonas benzenivorans]WPC05762.1 5'-nucleotidase [Pseudomonas benzenivorans]